ncbi:hypothetical protein [Ferruginibacter sp.]
MISYISICLLLLFSCARKYNISQAFRNGVPADMQKIVLDNTYKLYIREVFLDTADAGDKNVQSTLVPTSNATKLIEIEYLLFSAERGRAVYIATIPDKYQLYYAKKSKYLPREYLNAYDFSTFRFGKKAADGKGIVFENGQYSATWNYEMLHDSILHVYEVVERLNGDASNVYLVDEALSRKASFVQTDSFKIVFRNMTIEKKLDINEVKKGRKPYKRFWLDNTIYFRNENNKYSIYFRFDHSLPSGYKDSTISFGNARLVNAPFE